MNRLTFKKAIYDKERIVAKINKHTQTTFPIKNEPFPQYDIYLSGDVVDRLAAYEDTGLEPDEICEMMADMTKLIEERTEQQENECDHDFFLGCISEDLTRFIESEKPHREHYKIGTLICRRCGTVKQINVDVYDY